MVSGGGQQSREEIISIRLRNLTRGAFQRIRQDLTNTRRSVRRFVSQALSVANRAFDVFRSAAFGAAAGVTALSAALGIAFISSANHAKRITNIADTYGIAAQEVQALTNIINRAGIEGANVRDLFEGVTDALIKVQAGGEGIERALGLAGITTQQFLSGDILQRIELLAGGLASIEDPALRAAVSADLAEDSFQRYNSVLGAIARGSLQTVIDRENELTGVTLPAQNAALSAAQRRWKILSDRLLTFRQVVASQFTPAAITILKFLRDWVEEIEGPVSRAVAGLNEDVLKFLATQKVGDELAFALALEITDPSPAEQLRDQLESNLKETKDDILTFATDLYTLFRTAFSAPVEIPLDFDVTVGSPTPGESLRKQLSDSIIAERDRARQEISDTVTGIIDLALQAVVRRLTSLETYITIANAVIDGILNAFTVQNIVQGRTNSFSNRLRAGLELLLAGAVTAIAAKRLNLGGAGKLLVFAFVLTLVTDFQEFLAEATGIDQLNSTVATFVIGALAAAVILASKTTVGSTIISGAVNLLFTSFVKVVLIGAGGLTTLLKAATTVIASALVSMLSAAITVAVTLLSPLVTVAKVLATALVQIIAASFSGLHTLIVVALRALFRVAFLAVFTIGVAPLYIATAVSRMIVLLAGAITAITAKAAVTISIAIRLIFATAYAALFIVGSVVPFVVAMVARMILVLIAAINAANLVKLAASIVAMMAKAFVLARAALAVAPLAFILFTSHVVNLIAGLFRNPIGAVLTSFRTLVLAITRFMAIAIKGVIFAAPLIIGAAVGVFVSWLIGQLAVAIGVSNTNPVERAIAFIFNNILTNPGRVGAALIAAWKYIGDSIAYSLEQITVRAVNGVINIINSMIRQYNRLPKIFRIFGSVGQLSRVSASLSRPVRPVIPGLNVPEANAPRRDTSPEYGPQPANHNQVFPPVVSVPTTITVDGNDMRATFADFIFAEFGTQIGNEGFQP